MHARCNHCSLESLQENGLTVENRTQEQGDQCVMMTDEAEAAPGKRPRLIMETAKGGRKQKPIVQKISHVQE